MTTSSADLTPFWQKAQQENASRLSEISSQVASYPGKPLRIARVTQLDAQLLDNELDHILLEPVTKSLQLLRDPSTFLPELSAVLRFSLLSLGLQQSGASYGSRLQNLVYRDEWQMRSLHQASTAKPQPHTSRYTLYATLMVLPGYIHNKLRDFMLSKGWSDYPEPRNSFALFSPFNGDMEARDIERRKKERKRWVWETWNKAEQVWAFGKLINFLVFLYDGRYRTLIDRMLGLRLVYARRSFSRQVSFEFLNRQLVWEAFTEFLLFILPLINLRKIRLRISRFLSASPTIQSTLSILPNALRPTSRSTTSTDPSSQKTGLLAHLSPTTCPLCFTRLSTKATSAPLMNESDPTDPSTNMFSTSSFAPSQSEQEETKLKIPYQVGCCGGRYCYYCIVGQLGRWEEETQGLDGPWSCLRCGGEVVSVKRCRLGSEEEVLKVDEKVEVE